MMKTLIALAISTCALGGAAHAQKADPLACAKAVDGQTILIGAPVRESGGKEIGAVSLFQCSLDPGRRVLLVRLNPALGNEIKEVPLARITVSPGGVMLSLTEAELAAAPPARPVG